MDFIAPYGHAWAIANDLQRTAQTDHIVYATRRKPDGSIRKIGLWTGQNIRWKLKPDHDGTEKLHDKLEGSINRCHSFTRNDSIKQ